MDLNISEKVDRFLDVNFAGRETTIFRDLSVNLKKLLEDSSLAPDERFLITYAVGHTLHHQGLVDFAEEALKELDLTSEQITEAKEASGIMGMLNTYYKFKAMLSPESSPDYQRAGLRMMSLGKPQLGKDRFEMLALAISIINGCPSCIASHELALRKANIEVEKIHDLARLSSVLKGLSAL